MKDGAAVHADVPAMSCVCTRTDVAQKETYVTP